VSRRDPGADSGGRARWLAVALVLELSACSGGGPALTGDGSSGASACDGGCTTAASVLSVGDVQRIIAQGVAEARARGASATIAVSDRVGNVLAVYRMGVAATRVVQLAATDGNTTTVGGLEGIRLPVPATALAALNLDDQAAITKALTAAYLSSEGNAFSTRTASQIVQQHFNPGDLGRPSGPLFGVQFSQLACSDIVRASDGMGASAGPQRSPLGLAADPGGFPVYKAGALVGGVGVLADGRYGLDADISGTDQDLDESIAMAASYGYAAPTDRRADLITVDGRTLRFTDVEMAQLAANPANAPGFATLTPADGALLAVRGYTDGALRAGLPFGLPASGIRADGAADFPGLDAFVLVDATDTPRFAPRAGTDGSGALTRPEVVQLLRSALSVANHARAQIRRPLGSRARVSISVVDSNGVVLGLVRSRDAPVFGIDVAVQKARTAALLSSSTAASYITALPDRRYLTTTNLGLGSNTAALANYVAAVRSFNADPMALGDGAIAYSSRAVGNLSRPTFPDGIDGTVNGPLSKAAGQWSAFSVGWQLDLSINAILQHVLYVAGAVAGDVAPGCAGVDLSAALVATQTTGSVRLANGAQAFPGGMPVYRGAALVGGIGVSGDGVDQDDMIAFLGLSQAGALLGGVIDNAPTARRADTLAPQGVRLRYVQCPSAPFIDSNAAGVCDGL
jgi:uncharacterized protein GlcG (DUF336 family)